MNPGGFWKWELERRLAVVRWRREDAEFAAEGRSVQAERAPLLARRQQQLGVREHEDSMILFGELRPEEVEARVQRIAVEDAEWVALTSTWEADDRRRRLRRESAEARRCAEVERWLEENAWELVNLPMDLPAGGRLVQ